MDSPYEASEGARFIQRVYKIVAGWLGGDHAALVVCEQSCKTPCKINRLHGR